MDSKLKKLIEENAKLKMQIEEFKRNIIVTDEPLNPEIELDRNQQIVELCCDLHWEFYPDTLLTIFSTNYLDITGREKLIYEDFEEIKSLVHQDDIATFVDNINSVLQGKKDSFNYEFRWLREDGTYVWFNNRCLAFNDSNGKIKYILGLSNDVSEQRHREEVLQEEQLKNHLLLKTATDFIWEYNVQTHVFSFNPEILDFLGPENKDALLDEMKKFVDISFVDNEINIKMFQRIKIFNKITSTDNWFETTYFALNNSKGSCYKIIGTMKNIDEQLEEEEHLKNEVYIDPLTKVKNRRACDEHLTNIFNHHLETEQNYAVLFFDLDNFKSINDTYGHIAGDLVLQSFSKYCESFVNNLHGDIFRWGGEEFIAYFPFESQADALEQAKKLCREVADITVQWKKHIIKFTVSVGASQIFQQDKNYNDALERADYGVYQVKKNNKNNVFWVGNISIS